MIRKCTRSWEHDAVREGRLGAADAASFWRHVRTCSDCAAEVARDERLRAIGREWPTEAPGELDLRRLRARVLREAAHAPAPTSPPARRIAVGFAVAAALVAPWVVASLKGHRGVVAAVVASAWRAPEPVSVTSFAGSVVAASDVRWRQTRSENVERVCLEAGTIAVHVRPQVQGERFLVVLPDGELEVRGTTFQVTVAGGATTRVHVDEGTVEVRLRGEPDATLVAGGTWPAQPQPSSRPGGAEAGNAAVAQVARRPQPAGATVAPKAAAAALERHDDLGGPGRTEDVEAYAAAMRLLREGRAEDAASAFHAFASTHPGAPQAEDASFLEALALARAGRRDAAGLVAQHHLATYPHSFHGKDAAILVARAASLRGDCAGARAALAPWMANETVPRDSSDPEAAAALLGCDMPPKTTGTPPEKAEK